MTAYVAALLPDKLREGAVLIIFAFTLCCYVQTMFLNGKMQVLAGQTRDMAELPMKYRRAKTGSGFIIIPHCIRMKKEKWNCGSIK